MNPEQPPSLDKWDIRKGDDTPWAPWGADGNARAKTLGEADGYAVTLIEAEAGYRGGPHEHTHAELFFLVAGTVRSQGVELTAGDGYGAAQGQPTPTSRPSPPPRTSSSGTLRVPPARPVRFGGAVPLLGASTGWACGRLTGWSRRDGDCG